MDPVVASAIEQRPVNALIPYAKNARTHSPAQVAQIVASMHEFGFANPILIDSDRF
jgi:ParB-like chromosome segregation protein Spo0J